MTTVYVHADIRKDPGTTRNVVTKKDAVVARNMLGQAGITTNFVDQDGLETFTPDGCTVAEFAETVLETLEGVRIRPSSLAGTMGFRGHILHAPQDPPKHDKATMTLIKIYDEDYDPATSRTSDPVPHVRRYKTSASPSQVAIALRSQGIGFAFGKKNHQVLIYVGKGVVTLMDTRIRRLFPAAR